MGIAAAAIAQDVPSFKGKTITMLVGSDAGGGSDVAGRLIAIYLRKYLPGEPAIVVQNMSGGSGIAAMNFFVHRTEPNGLTVLMGSISTIDPVLFRNANAQYDPKTFRYIGGLGRGGSVIFVSRAAQPRLYDKSAKPVIIGSVQSMPRPGTQPILWCIEYLGWNATWVSGYHGTDEIMLALDRGEIDMTSTGNIFQIQDRLDRGLLKIIYQTGALKDGRIVGRADLRRRPAVSGPDEGQDHRSGRPQGLRSLDHAQHRRPMAGTGARHARRHPDGLSGRLRQARGWQSRVSRSAARRSAKVSPRCRRATSSSWSARWRTRQARRWTSLKQ